MVVSLATSHSPNEFHAYILDLGGRNFRSLEGLPHVGGVIYADEEAYEERLQRLLDKLNRMVEERQQVLSNADANNLYEYNENQPEAILPAVLVVIDNFAELRENHEALVEAALIPLVRRSLSMGISFVVTGNLPNSMPSKLYNLLGERVTFKQADPERYMDIVGRGAIEIDDVAGRGYIRVGRRPLLFHAAQPVGIFDEETGERDYLAEGDELRLMAEHMQARIGGDGMMWSNRPDPIDILPEIVSLVDMLADVGSVRANRRQAVLGENSSLQPALFDLKRMGPHFVVVGPPLSGKTTLLYNWVLSLASRYSPKQVLLVLVDLQQKFFTYGGNRTLGELPHVITTISEIEELEAFLINLKNECDVLTTEGTAHEVFVIIDNFDDFSDELKQARDADKELATIARRYGRDGIHFVISTMPDSSVGVNEFKRRVQSANYGIGLQSAQSLDVLRVTRRPAAAFRGKALPVGRGFIVKSGQPTMIQVASPYEGVGVGIGEYEEEERVAQALDAWVERICAMYPDEQAAWSQPVEITIESSSDNGYPVADKDTKLAIDLLKRIVYKQANGNKEEIAAWDDKTVLRQFIEDALRDELNGMDPSMLGTTFKEIVDAAAGYFPELGSSEEDGS